MVGRQLYALGYFSSGSPDDGGNATRLIARYRPAAGGGLASTWLPLGGVVGAAEDLVLHVPAVGPRPQ
jgi:hypothetical protein